MFYASQALKVAILDAFSKTHVSLKSFVDFVKNCKSGVVGQFEN